MSPKYNGLVAIDAAISLNGLKNTAVKVFDVPEKFVVVGVLAEVVKKPPSTDADPTLMFEYKVGDSATTLGKTFTIDVDGSTMESQYSAPTEESITGSQSGATATTIPSFKFLASGAQIQVKTGSSTALTGGVVGLTVYGFADRFCDYASAGDNKASADPYTPPEKQ